MTRPDNTSQAKINTKGDNKMLKDFLWGFVIGFALLVIWGKMIEDEQKWRLEQNEQIKYSSF